MSAASGKGPRTETDVDPAERATAQRIAREVVDCDTSVLSLIVVDRLGRVLHVARSSRLPAEEQVDPQLIQVFGTIAMTIVGAANNAATIMGATEAIIGVFKKQKILLINLKEYELLLAIRLARSASAEYVSDKVGKLLSARGEA